MRLCLKEEERQCSEVFLSCSLVSSVGWSPGSDPQPSLPLCHFLRASILEMRKDHEHQLQRLKMLKDQEIDAVTSATSHTRYVLPAVCCLLLLPKAVLAVPRMRRPDDPQVPERHHRADGEVLQQPEHAVLPRGGLTPHHLTGTGAGHPAAG